MQVKEEITLNKKKTRVGKVQRIRDDDVLVEGLASSKSIAESLIEARISSASGAGGIIRATFGTRGVVSATFDKDVKKDDEVYYERLVEEEYNFGPR